MKKYNVSLKKNGQLIVSFITYEKLVKTNDIYHEIGYLYCTELQHIERIDFVELKDVDVEE